MIKKGRKWNGKRVMDRISEYSPEWQDVIGGMGKYTRDVVNEMGDAILSTHMQVLHQSGHRSGFLKGLVTGIIFCGIIVVIIL